MAYSKTTWADRVVQNPLTYTLRNNADGTVTLIPAEGTIVTSGTPITASVMNNLETQYDLTVALMNSFGLGTDAPVISDVNAPTATGFYQTVATTTNTPTTNGGTLIHITRAGRHTQIYQDYTLNATYTRSLTASGWTTWKQVATTTLEAWTNLTLVNSWVSSGGTYPTPGYRKNNFGEVELRGNIKSGVITGGTIIATLPTNYRPLFDKVYPVICNNGTSDIIGRINIVAATGNITIQTGANALLSLDSIPPIPTT